jgi:hypothetical protein
MSWEPGNNSTEELYFKESGYDVIYQPILILNVYYNQFQVVEARKGYVRRVSSIRVQELGASINRLIQNSKKTSSEPLFECLLVVGLNRDPYTGVYHAYIRDKFPPNVRLILLNNDDLVFLKLKWKGFGVRILKF